MSGQNEDRQDQDKLAAAARRHTEEVSPEVAERLRAMRRVAVSELGEGPANAAPGWLWPAGVAAAGVALTLALLLGEPDGSAPDPLLLADADELAVVADLDVLEELEFLAWLEEEGPDDGEG
ncbi:hypothetical protein [Wenzhouxiangella sp. XN24]|uniref:hypothetical protein n=1 Tax=Wenzhouxiangella sp. XN24 TaxID=2713569 RepID=UPI0013EDAA55|nr:hypothetical protein [Wenzhouxiangella sp. XN24]NGX16296.1 hypothetical protein [Wenzhouxiangella sp. XN24]